MQERKSAALFVLVTHISVPAGGVAPHHLFICFSFSSSAEVDARSHTPTPPYVSMVSNTVTDWCGFTSYRFFGGFNIH